MYENPGHSAQPIKTCSSSSNVSVAGDWESLSKIQLTQPVITISPHIYDTSRLPSLSVAQGISDVYREVYHDTHPDKSLINPNLIIQKIARGDLIYAVLQDQQKKVLAVGALAYLNYFGASVENYGSIRELGKLAVLPEAQNLKLAQLITKMRIEYATELGVSSLVSVAVGSHTASQHTLSKNGFRPSGISIRDWKDIKTPGQRESSVFMHNIIDSTIRLQRDVFIPNELAHAARIAYGSLGCMRTIIDTKQIRSFTSACTKPSINPDLESSNAQCFLHCSSDVDTLIKTINQDPYKTLKHISVTLDISKPESSWSARKLLDNGFCFSGIHPFAKTDLLTLQKVSDIPDDFVSHIQLADPVSLRILTLSKCQYY